MATTLKVTITDDLGNTFLAREEVVGNVAKAASSLKYLSDWFADDVLSNPQAYGLKFGSPTMQIVEAIEKSEQIITTS